MHILVTAVAVFVRERREAVFPHVTLLTRHPDVAPLERIAGVPAVAEGRVGVQAFPSKHIVALITPLQ